MKTSNYLFLLLMLLSLGFLSFFLIPYKTSENYFNNAIETPIKLSSNDEYDKIIDDFLANKFTSQNQQYPSICALTSETFAVAWESYTQDGSEFGVYARVFNATTGVNLTREFQVNYETNNNACRVIGKSQAGDIVALVNGLETMDDVGRLVGACVY